MMATLQPPPVTQDARGCREGHAGSTHSRVWRNEVEKHQVMVWNRKGNFWHTGEVERNEGLKGSICDKPTFLHWVVQLRRSVCQKGEQQKQNSTKEIKKENAFFQNSYLRISSSCEQKVFFLKNHAWNILWIKQQWDSQQTAGR